MADAEEKIRKALLTFMERFPYDAISVQGICDEAGLSRKTFSRHFASKEDVVTAQLRADIAAPTATVLSVLSAAPFNDSARILLLHAYSAFYDRRAFYTSVAKVLGLPWLSEQVMAAGKWIGTVPYEKDDITDEREMDFVVTLYSGITATVLCWWLQNDFVLSPERVVDLVIKWVYDGSPSGADLSV
ncbi:MAG: TetR/AcrR family transcriptional regulator [Eggerthellaceae bacterium]|nr:TetR/AcrR family transcriptional regulator [Eggerthellaceae bacterium]